MVALFVIATILLAVGIELIRGRARQRKGIPDALVHHTERFLLPRGYFISKAHTWVEVTFAGEARIGLDDFAQKVIGPVDRIEILPLGKEVKKGETLFTMRHHDRVLSVPAPLSGTVLKVNDSVLTSPNILRRDPYGSGWVAMIAPKSISAELRLLSIADEAAQWLKNEVGRFRDFIRSHAQAGIPSPAGATLLDGGAPLNGALDQFNENAWAAFQKEFLKSE